MKKLSETQMLCSICEGPWDVGQLTTVNNKKRQHDVSNTCHWLTMVATDRERARAIMCIDKTRARKEKRESFKKYTTMS